MEIASIDKLLTVPAFAGWLSMQPQGEVYTYMDDRDCPLARCLSKMGLIDVAVGGVWVWTGIGGNRRRLLLPRIFDDIVCARPHTYGAAYLRCHLLHGNISG